MLRDTELRLSFWRDGSTKAERLAAAALQLSGYEEMDPQSPLGGPDGKKDILCTKGGLTWVAAVYFPIAPVSFSAVRRKFKSDLDGAPSAPQGFVFVTNQNISPTQRKSLSDLGKNSSKEIAVLHLQQLQTMLDSPVGYGVRIQYLGIGMSIEEQLSWAAESDSQTARALTVHTRELVALRTAVERIGSGQQDVLRTLSQLPVSNLSTPNLIASASFAKHDKYPSVTADLSPQQILLFHRLVCFDLPTRAIGALRSDEVWLGNLEGKRAEHLQPPPARDVPKQLEQLCESWRSQFHLLRAKEAKLGAIAGFHAKFLHLHPFLDGNGRAARAILMQQCLDLFNKADMTLMNKGAVYYSALKAADNSDLIPLVELIVPIVSS